MIHSRISEKGNHAADTVFSLAAIGIAGEKEGDWTKYSRIIYNYASMKGGFGYATEGAFCRHGKTNTR